MSDRPSPGFTTRKSPKQARSAQLVADILTAAAQVLARDGAHRFTTARVAEKAGVSVGSLYQYFPNKAAILFRLQADEWRETGAMLRDILEDRARSPLDRVRACALAFVRSECEEAAMRGALDDAAPLYRDAPEAEESWRAGARMIEAFLEEALPDTPATTRAVAGDIFKMALSGVGKSISEHRWPIADADHYASALADMLCAYLARLAAEPGLSK